MARKTKVANETLAEMLDRMTRVGDLWRPEGERIRCFACGHYCLIGEGLRGICKVRFNKGGKLYVPWGYVAALQNDPIEKKPFFHVLPGRQTLTFGMLGCDYKCPYCFPEDTPVLTADGVVPIGDIFERGKDRLRLHDGEITFPDIQVFTRRGELKPVRAAFRHPYRGELVCVHVPYLPPLRCTPDHHIFVGTREGKVELIPAAHVTPGRFLLTPKYLAVAEPVAMGTVAQVSGMGHNFSASTSVHTEIGHFYAVPIERVEKEPFEGYVYNLEVDDPDHTYLAGFFAVSNCQNWLTSQALRDPAAGARPERITPEEMVALAKRLGSAMITSSYNEPLITAEWAVDIFKLAKPEGFKTAFVSNGNATREALEYLRPWVDAYKIDLKSMNDRNYRILGGKLENVLNAIKMVYEMGFWLEIVTLVVPGFNDSEEELRAAAEYIASISPEIPWHVTAFHQDYKMTDPRNTTAEDLIRAAEIGREAGLHFVYAGNLPGMVGNYENTYCPDCKALLIRRYGFWVLENRLGPDGLCPDCGRRIPGIWA